MTMKYSSYKSSSYIRSGNQSHQTHISFSRGNGNAFQFTDRVAGLSVSSSGDSHIISRKDTPHQQNGYEKYYSYPTQVEMMRALKAGFPKQYVQIVQQFRSSDKVQDRLNNNFNRIHDFSSSLQPFGFVEALSGGNLRQADQLLSPKFLKGSEYSR